MVPRVSKAQSLASRVRRDSRAPVDPKVLKVRRDSRALLHRVSKAATEPKAHKDHKDHRGRHHKVPTATMEPRASRDFPERLEHRDSRAIRVHGGHRDLWAIKDQTAAFRAGKVHKVPKVPYGLHQVKAVPRAFRASKVHLANSEHKVQLVHKVLATSHRDSRANPDFLDSNRDRDHKGHKVYQVLARWIKVEHSPWASTAPTPVPIPGSMLPVILQAESLTSASKTTSAR